jgi:hypothetical protein
MPKVLGWMLEAKKNSYLSIGSYLNPLLTEGLKLPNLMPQT